MDFRLARPGLSPSDVVAKAFQLFFLIISFITAAGLNGIVSYSLLRKRRLFIAGNCFVFSLTLSNFIDSFLSIPFLISSGTTNDWSLGNVSCTISAFMHLLVSVNSNLTLALIALDRYYAIVKPMKYHAEITNSKSMCMLMSIWLLSLIACIPPLWGWSNYVYHPSLFICIISWHLHPVYSGCILVTMVLAPFVIMLVCYSFIYMAASLQQRSTLTSYLDDPTVFASNSTKLKQKLPWLVITYSNAQKARRTLVIILFSYGICWGVVLLWMVLEFAHIDTRGALSFLAFLVHRASSIFYPLIYGFMNRSIRRRICRMLCKRRKKSKTINFRKNSSSDNLSTSSTLNSFFDYLPRKFTSSSYGIDSSDILKKLKPLDYSVPSTPVSRRSISPRMTPRSPKKRCKSVPTRTNDSNLLQVPDNHRRRRTSPKPYGTCESFTKKERTPSVEDDCENVDSFDESELELSDRESPEHNSQSPIRKTVYFFPPTDNLDLVMEVDDGDSGIEFTALTSNVEVKEESKT